VPTITPTAVVRLVSPGVVVVVVGTVGLAVVGFEGDGFDVGVAVGRLLGVAVG